MSLLLPVKFEFYINMNTSDTSRDTSDACVQNNHVFIISVLEQLTVLFQNTSQEPQNKMYNTCQVLKIVTFYVFCTIYSVDAEKT